MPLDKEVSLTSLSEGGIAELLILIEFDNVIYVVFVPDFLVLFLFCSGRRPFFRGSGGAAAPRVLFKYCRQQ